VRQSVEREVDSLEGVLILSETRGVHENDRSLGGTRATDEESVKKTDFLSALRAHLRKGAELLNDVFNTLRISGGDKQL
jgi:hypothetical protein